MEFEQPNCYGTKEYSDKSGICKKCKYKIKCKDLKKKNLNVENISYIKRADYRVWRN